jgi:hypothetical protein
MARKVKGDLMPAAKTAEDAVKLHRHRQPELQSWQKAEAELIEAKIECLEGAIMGLARIDGMFTTNELISTTTACINLYKIEVENLTKRLERLTAKVT